MKNTTAVAGNAIPTAAPVVREPTTSAWEKKYNFEHTTLLYPTVTAKLKASQNEKHTKM